MRVSLARAAVAAFAFALAVLSDATARAQAPGSFLVGPGASGEYAVGESGEDLLLPPQLDATYSEWEPGIDPIYPDSNAFKVNVETPEGANYNDIEDPAFISDLEKLTG